MSLLDSKKNVVPKKVKKWEKRWILIPNVYQFGEDVWVHKWVNDDQILESNQLLKKKQEKATVKNAENESDGKEFEEIPSEEKPVVKI